MLASSSCSQTFLRKICTMSFFTRFLNLRSLCSSTAKNAEQTIHRLLISRFPQATVKVTDVSGGCGAMFEVFVEAQEFKGLNTLKQHKMVTNTLKEQIKEMHGVRIHTSIPDKI